MSYLNRLDVLVVLLVTSCVAKAQLFEDFMTSRLDPNKWQVSDGYQNSSSFNCTWRASSVGIDTTSPGYMTFSLKPDTAGTGNPPYASGEIRSVNTFGYGLYEVRMKASPEPGVISAYVTYTGPYYGTQWDEIDIEFGKFGDHSHTMLQCNYYVNGVGGHKILVDLGFDPTADYHVYAFDWEPSGIKWYVDGVLKAQTPAGANLPVTPSRIYANLWPTYGLDNWAGTYTGNPTRAVYDWCKFTPAGSASIRMTNATFSTSAVAVSRNGGVLNGAATIANSGSVDVVLQRVVITSRPPGGTNAGGPYYDFQMLSNVTVHAGETLQINQSRTFQSSDPTGRWYGYLTYETQDGVWHDGYNFYFSVY
jgi:beta-glucanase (GH16 family)